MRKMKKNKQKGYDKNGYRILGLSVMGPKRNKIDFLFFSLETVLFFPTIDL